MTHNHPVFVYTDHANLVPLLRPNWNSKLIYADKMYRWALQLQQADRVVFHISSTANFAADLLTRWAAREEVIKDDKEITTSKVARVRDTVPNDGKQIVLKEELLIANYCRANRAQMITSRTDDSTRDNGVYELTRKLKRKLFIDENEMRTRSSRKEIELWKEYAENSRTSFMSRYYQGNWRPIGEKELIVEQKKELRNIAIKDVPYKTPSGRLYIPRTLI